jgi:mannose-6-phosphate isomerase-like protein (cupin superfamily)
MKLFVPLFLACLWPLAADSKPDSATYVTAAEIQSTLKTVPQDQVTDAPIRVVDVGKGNAGVAVVLRSAKPAQTAVDHEQVTEVYYVLEGSGIMVTGGRLEKPTLTQSPIGGPTNVGTAIEKGESRKVGPGDVVIIPAGVAHGFTKIDGDSIRYVVVRFDPDKVLPKK